MANRETSNQKEYPKQAPDTKKKSIVIFISNLKQKERQPQSYLLLQSGNKNGSQKTTSKDKSSRSA